MVELDISPIYEKTGRRKTHKGRTGDEKRDREEEEVGKGGKSEGMGRKNGEWSQWGVKAM